jgi:hypothetical protein
LLLFAAAAGTFLQSRSLFIALLLKCLACAARRRQIEEEDGKKCRTQTLLDKLTLGGLQASQMEDGTAWSSLQSDDEIEEF